jgi:hypothetical protein
MQEPAKTKVTVIGAKGKVLKNVLIKAEVEIANRSLYEQALKRQYPSVKKFKWESGTFHMVS